MGKTWKVVKIKKFLENGFIYSKLKTGICHHIS
jgi:hypothetical protein